MKKVYTFYRKTIGLLTAGVIGMASIATAQVETLDFAGLSAGTLLDEQYASQGIHISADADDGHPDMLMVFNSDGTGSADPDLEVGIGNLAIFPYNSNDIDDTPDGGKQYYEFDEDVTIISLDFVDKDNGNPGKLHLYDAFCFVICSCMMLDTFIVNCICMMLRFVWISNAIDYCINVYFCIVYTFAI